MDKIDHFTSVVKLLKRGEIVCIAQPQQLYFGLQGQLISAYNKQVQYLLSWATFSDLFKECEFTLYEKKEEIFVDKTKDDEYYRWKHK